MHTHLKNTALTGSTTNPRICSCHFLRVNRSGAERALHRSLPPLSHSKAAPTWHRSPPWSCRAARDEGFGTTTSLFRRPLLRRRLPGLHRGVCSGGPRSHLGNSSTRWRQRAPCQLTQHSGASPECVISVRVSTHVRVFGVARVASFRRVLREKAIIESQ